jgi:PAS domain S-box-containing protein
MMLNYPVRVLIVDDDEDDFLIIREILYSIAPNVFDIDWSHNYDESLLKIKSGYYHIHFVDYRLGKETGLALLKEAVKAGCEAPIIMLTGRGNKEIDIEAMRLGATDYLIKSELNAEKLERCIRYALERTNYIKSLRESEKKYKHLFEGAKDAVFIADKNLKFIEINPAAETLLGKAFSLLSDITLYDFINDEDQKTFIKEQMEQGHNIQDIEISINNRNNGLRHCQLSLTVQTPDHHHEFVYGIMHDITNIKIANNTKIQLEKLAANERLIRLIAHEIRNPLTNIHLSVDHLKLSFTNDELEPYVGIIERNGVRINELISELLNYSKPIELLLEHVPLQQIIEKCLEENADRLQLKNIELIRDYPARPLDIIADRQKLVIAISNIIVNAIEAMEEKEGKLSVRIDDSRDRYLLHIRDNGKGIPEEYLSKITEPFFTLKRKGMGIGLPSALAILQSHHAQVEINSKVGAGTSFVIYFEKAAAVNQNKETLSLIKEPNIQ